LTLFRIALYTATIGKYEHPSQILSHTAADGISSGVDCYRFTDSAAADVNDQNRQAQPPWKAVQHAPRLPTDPIRSARAIKILGDSALSAYDVTVWIDNRVRLKIPAEELVERFLPSDADIAVPLHSYRRSLSDEFDAILSGRFDDPRRVREQRFAYAQAIPHLPARPVYWTAILIRRNNATIRAFNTIWWEQVVRYSRRDQLSFPYACDMVPELGVAPITVDNFESDFHEWRKTSDVGRQSSAGHWSPASLKTELIDTARFLKDRLEGSSVRREILPNRWRAGS
jgi:hypothetical protein